MSYYRNRIDFVQLIECVNGNPNGDPDMANLPRTDPQSNRGLISDVARKARIRAYVSLKYERDETDHSDRNNIFVRHHSVLGDRQQEAYEALGLDDSDNKDKKKKRDRVRQARDWMCKTFWDVRTFGAVMSVTDFNAGQVRGPVQLTFAQSVHPIEPEDMAITRRAVANQKDAASHDELQTMGRKTRIPYGLYVGYGFFSPAFARQTGFDQADRDLLFEALTMMYEVDRSASKGLMSTRGLYAFEHESELGNAPAHALFDRIRISPKEGKEEAPRSFEDFTVEVHEADLPAGVSLQRIVG